MKINATVFQVVTIEPVDVIKQLIEDVKGYNGWIFEEGGKYYRGYGESRLIDGKEEISKETYEYYLTLNTIIEYEKVKSKNYGIHI